MTTPRVVPSAAANGRATDLAGAHSAQLTPIVVTGRPERASYKLLETHTATGTETPLIDVPQTITAIPKVVLRDQAAQSLEDAMRNAPGVYIQQGEGNRDEFYIRGVKTKSDFFLDGLRDDTEYFRDLYNVAHVDVLQGPAALLFGRGGAGGIINLVTYKPERRRIREMSFETGSFDHYRATLDVGDTVGESGAFRLLAMGENSGGFRQHAYLHRYAFNPTFRYQLGDATQIDVGFSYLKDDRFADRGIPSRNGRPVDVNRDTFFGAPDVNRAHSRVMAGTVRIKHRLNAHVKLRNAFRVTGNKRRYTNAYPGSSVDSTGHLKLKAYDHPSDRLSYIDQAEMIADFDTGAFSHTLLAGIQYSWQRGNDVEYLPSPGSKAAGTVTLSDPTIPALAFPYLDRNNHVVGKEFGVYAQDQIAFGKHWMAIAGVRWDQFTVDADYRAPGVTPDHTHNVDTEWSPRGGLIFKPVANDAIYVSISQTFTPSGANIALSQKSPDTAHLDPEKATNYEIGNKLDLFDGDLSITAALFQLDLKDVTAKAPDGSGRLVSTGAQRNRGVELSAEGTLTRKWSVYANYTYIDAKITKTTKGAQAGARVGLVPHNQFSIWTRYALTPHWGVGAGVLGATGKYTSFDNDVRLPGFVVGNLMAYYQAHRYRVQVNVDNVTDRSYYPTASGDNQIMPGAPVNVRASLRVRF